MSEKGTFDYERASIFQKFAFEMLRPLHESAVTALKSAMLINGGAAVAVLAFTGTVWSTTLETTTVYTLTIAIIIFSAGVLTASTGMIANTILYHIYFDILTDVIFDKGRQADRPISTILWLMLAAIGASFVLFAGGVYFSCKFVFDHLISA